MAVDPEDQSSPTPPSHFDAVSESSSSPADTPDHSPIPLPDSEFQSPAALRSEEYRQLFRLPLDEVLIEDFNCACQENILIQGHMYLFLQHICFYSNIFGYETKKTIPLCEITGVKRAKTAGIFPNAIEIIAGGKKHFFGSFLSRDEAFKLINEGWLRNCNGADAITEQQETSSESSFHSSGLVIEKARNSECRVEELGTPDRDDSVQTILDPEPIPIEDDTPSTSISELKENVEQDTPVVLADSLSSRKTWAWKEENSDAPKIPEYYTMVAESKFPIEVKDFFSFFFSEDSFNFTETFHGRCGDKGRLHRRSHVQSFYNCSRHMIIFFSDFKCTSWVPHNQFGHTRNVEFLHPIKIYFGAKFGSCKEAQKFQVYRNSHLVIESSQDIIDVPYGDYFCVEALWDIQKDSSESKECCYLRVYVNVAFSKKTVFKGKIVQSTMEECREVYGIWINMAHELLKKNNLEKKEGNDPNCSVVGNSEAPLERETEAEESLERPHKSSHHTRTLMTDTMDANQVGSNMQGNLFNTNSVASALREPAIRFWTSLKTHSHFPPLLAITFVVIILMQLSIVMLLARPQKVYVISPTGYVNVLGSGDAEKSVEVIRLLEKRIHHLKDEMLTVEMHLERMRHEHDLLKAQLKDLRYMGIHR